VTTALHVLAILFTFVIVWIVGGVVLFAPAPGGRPGILGEKYIGWYIIGYWAVIGGWALFAELVLS
jgi:hypothetical protein